MREQDAEGHSFIIIRTRSETRFAGLFARLPVGNEILRRSPTNMKRDHNSGDLSGTLSILGDLRGIFGGHLRHFRGPMGTLEDL